MKTYRIVSPSFWSSRREITDSSGAKIGHFLMTSHWTSKGEGEAEGRRFKFQCDNWWDTRHATMTDMSEKKIATIKPKGWWGTEFAVQYDGAEYSWQTNGWGSGFSLFKDTVELATVKEGMWKLGKLTLHESADIKKLLPLILFGLYRLQVYGAENSASTGTYSAAT